jgi:hypothetical protein
MNSTGWLDPKVSGETKDGGESRERLEPRCGNLGLFWLRVITRYIPPKRVTRCSVLGGYVWASDRDPGCSAGTES